MYLNINNQSSCIFYHSLGAIQYVFVLLLSHAFLEGNIDLVGGFLQALQDDLLSKEIEVYRSLDNNQIPPPLERLQRYHAELNPDTETSTFNTVVGFCMRDMYHYARVSGLHVLECVMDTALSAVKREQLQEASNVCAQFYV